MSTKLPVLYSMFGLAGTGGEGDSSCMVCAVLTNSSNNGDSSDKNWKKQTIAESQRNVFANSLLDQGLSISKIEFLKY